MLASRHQPLSTEKFRSSYGRAKAAVYRSRMTGRNYPYADTHRGDFDSHGVQFGTFCAALVMLATMVTRIANVTGAGWFMRIVFHAPIWLYRFHLGWILRDRFLMVNHVGAKTGLLRRAVLEVIKSECSQDHYWVVSGYGAHAQWYKNLVKTPAVIIQVGSRVLRVMAHEVGAQERADVLLDYLGRNPIAGKPLMRMLGYLVDGSDEDYCEVARIALRMFVFKPLA
jgi:deazaflavin-dependent oxidoreductase (nitroreductase family)